MEAGEQLEGTVKWDYLFLYFFLTEMKFLVFLYFGLYFVLIFLIITDKMFFIVWVLIVDFDVCLWCTILRKYEWPVEFSPKLFLLKLQIIPLHVLDFPSGMAETPTWNSYRLKQGMANCDSGAKLFPLPIFVNKMYWNMATPTHLHNLYGWFHTTKTEVTTCN